MLLLSFVTVKYNLRRIKLSGTQPKRRQAVRLLQFKTNASALLNSNVCVTPLIQTVGP